MTVGSLLVRCIHCSLKLVLRVTPENADAAVFFIQRSLFVHSNQLYTYITLLSSPNLFDVILTKLNALRKHLFHTGTILNYYP